MVTLVMIVAIAMLPAVLVAWALIQAACEHLDNVEARRRHHHHLA